MSPLTAPVNSPRIAGRLSAAAVIIAGAALAAYHGTFRVPFLFDDARAILENPGIRHLWPPGQAFWPHSPGMTVSGRPVANFTLAVNYALSGDDAWSYHALNLLIHVLSGWALFGVVRRTLAGLGRAVPNPPSANSILPDRHVADNTPYLGDAGDGTWLALAVALLWTLHPLQTEAVTYVVQRVESLMGLFFLLTLYCFIRGATCHLPSDKSGQPPPATSTVRHLLRDKPLGGEHRLWFALSFLACLLGVATKEVMATAPLMVLLYDRTFVAGTFRAAWQRRRWLHLSLAATWLPLLGFVATTGWNRGRTAGFNIGVSPWAYWLTQFEAVARYLWLSVWPHPLVFEYGTFWAHAAGQVAPFALVVVPLMAATVIALWRRPVLGFLGAWFFAILAPTSVVPGAIQMIVEHRMYLPLAAVIALGVFGLQALLRRPGLTLTLTLALALPLGLLTARRNTDYRSALALWSDTVAKRPGNPRARSGMGLALDHAGRTGEAVEQLEAAVRLSPGDADIHDNLGVTLEHSGRIAEAMQHYETALRLRPDFPEAHSNRGNVLLRTGRIPEAIREYEAALGLRPDFAEAHYNLGGAFDQAGRTKEAIQEFEAAVRLKPDYGEAHNNLGNILYRIGRTREAIQHYETALRIQPDLARAHHNLGLAFERTGQTAEAIRQYEAALQIQPDLAETHNNLGVLLCRGGRVAEGLAHLHEALRLQPDYARGHFNLGVALAQAGRAAEAIGAYTEAVRLQPDLVEARNNLGVLLGQSGRLAEAIAQFQAALRLQPDNADTHNNLGNALRADRQWDEAIGEFAEVVRLRPGDDSARQTLELARAQRAAALSGR